MQLHTLTPWGLKISLSLAIVYAANGILRRILQDFKSSKSRRTLPTGEPAYGGLESLVSFSACLIAARRALETEQPDPYIVDLLAAGLCGREALEARRAADEAAITAAVAPPAPPPAPPLTAGSTIAAPDGTSAAPVTPSPQQPLPQSRQRPIERLIMRTKFFDDVVSVVTWRGDGPSAAAASHSCHIQLLAECRKAAPCLQVVLLGSGLDARPWRLPLPSGVRWFEVDRQDVLAAKKQRLRALGAQLTGPGKHTSPPPAPAPLPASPPLPALPALPAAQLGITIDNGGSETVATAVAVPAQVPNPIQGTGGQTEQDGPGQRTQTAGAVPQHHHHHALQAACWRVCVVDLARCGWSRGLLRQGLDRSAPVLWVLEGLLYYLEEADVKALLREAASVSGRGSILAASVIQGAKKVPSVARSETATSATSAKYATTPLAAAAGEGAVGLTAAATIESGAAPVALAGKEAAGPGGASDGASGGAPGEGVVSQVLQVPQATRESDKGTPSEQETRRARYNLNSEFKWRCEGEVPEFINSCGWSTLHSLAWTEVAASYGLPTVERSSVVYFVTAVSE